MPLLCEVEFGSLLVYSPKGQEQASRNSKAVCYAIKDDKFILFQGRPCRAIPHFCGRLKAKLPGSVLEELFASKPVLVPAPRSAPAKPGTLYPALKICESLVEVGLGQEVRLLLERVKAVPKAATSTPADRPTIESHYDSLSVSRELVSSDAILVVDDVVTRGTMFLASISRLKDVYPTKEIRAFAMVRTMSGVEVPSFLDICRGTIARNDRWGQRRP